MRRIRIKGVNDMKEYAFGIDLGGTTAKVGLFTTSGKLLEKWEVSTDTSNNGAHILENLAAAVQQKMQEKGLSADEVEGVGLGVPGPVLDSSIVPIVCANLGGWGNRNVSIELSELLGGIRVLVGNDANVAALGEIWMDGALYVCGHCAVRTLCLFQMQNCISHNCNTFFRLILPLPCFHAAWLTGFQKGRRPFCSLGLF